MDISSFSRRDTWVSVFNHLSLLTTPQHLQHKPAPLMTHPYHVDNFPRFWLCFFSLSFPLTRKGEEALGRMASHCVSRNRLLCLVYCLTPLQSVGIPYIQGLIFQYDPYTWLMIRWNLQPAVSGWNKTWHTDRAQHGPRLPHTPQIC